MKNLLIILIICFLASPVFAQTEDVLLTRSIQLADGEFHKLEIKSDGVYIDGVAKGRLKRSSVGFNIAVLIMETPEYWAVEDSGFYYLLGVDTATGMCGIPAYAAIYVDANGNVRVSDVSPSACVGDFPSSVEFKLNVKVGERLDDATPIWKLSTALEFNGRTFLWRDLQKVAKPKATKRRKSN